MIDESKATRDEGMTNKKIRQPNPLTIKKDRFGNPTQLYPWHLDLKVAKRLQEWANRLVVWLEQQEQK